MIISDLNHLEAVTEASTVLGGTCKCRPQKKHRAPAKKRPVIKIFLPFILNKQVNNTVINQTQKVTAKAVSGGHGSSTAIAAGGDQSATVEQSNTALAL